MSYSLDIPSEISQEIPPMQSINIEVRQETKDYLMRDTANSAKGDQQFSLKYAEKAEPLETRPFFQDWLHSPTQEENLSSDSEDEGFVMANSYKKILLKDRNSTQLIQRFVQEPYSLRKSGVEVTDFSIEACFNRLATFGYKVLMVNYKTYEVEELRIKVNNIDVEWHRGSSATSIRFDQLGGIFIGDSSSTFKLYKQNRGDLRKYNIKPTDCMTILSDFRNFDFATTEDQAKYDIFTVISWKVSSIASKGSIIPLCHGKIATVIIKMKLNALAKSKYLFLEELLLLGIIKTLILKNEDPKKIAKVKAILDKKFALDQTLFRICFLMKPKNFIIPEGFNEKFDDRQRMRKLTQKIVDKVIYKNPRELQFVRMWENYTTNRHLKLKGALSKKNKTLTDANLSPNEKFQKSFTKAMQTINY